MKFYPYKALHPESACALLLGGNVGVEIVHPLGKLPKKTNPTATTAN